MESLSPFDQIRVRLDAAGSRGTQVLPELDRLCKLLPLDPEMALVRGRRILDIVLRSVLTERVGPAGTRPLDNVITELEKARLLPRETAAHARSLKEMANPCAHDGSIDEEGIAASLIHLAVVLKWYSTHVESSAEPSPALEAVDGLRLGDSFDEIEEILALDGVVYGELDPDALGSCERSRSWFARNPQIYSVLKSAGQVVGYSNIMPLEDEAYEMALAGRLHDGLVVPDMIQRYELPGSYRLYVCSLAIHPRFRKYPAAFRLLYDAFFERLFRLAEMEMYVSEIACNAWTADGRSLARSFGMSSVGPHDRHGEIHRCTIVPPGLSRPAARLRELLGKYGELGFSA